MSAVTGLISSLGPVPTRDHPLRPVYGANSLVCPVSQTPSFDDFTPSSSARNWLMIWRAPLWRAYREAFGDLVARVDGVERRAEAWPDWAVTTAIDTRAVWARVWNAVQCHASQVSGYAQLAGVSAEHHEAIWGAQEFYRVWSRVEVGRGIESDLFEGLR